MKVAVVGVTGLVGTRIIEVLEERGFPVSELIPVASERSLGKKIIFKGEDYEVVSAEKAIESKPELAIFSAGSMASLEIAPKFAAIGCRVVDNSSCWRMDPTKKLIIPEINQDVLTCDDYIIANPNCSTIQMLLPLAPLHKKYKIKRIVVSTYQSVTGSGNNAVAQMNAERNGEKWGDYPAFYPYPIDENSIGVSATTARVPVLGGHSESINLEFEKDFEIDDIRSIWESSPGIVVQDEPSENIYPMPLYSLGKDDVFVGRLRRDFSLASGINFWCVSDNIRKGAATNAIQIAEAMIDKGLLPRY